MTVGVAFITTINAKSLAGLHAAVDVALRAFQIIN
jgi:hypothetical protein